VSKRLDPVEQERLIERLAVLLDQARRDRRLLTYLEVADALAVPGPHRIHKTTRLLEMLLKQDVEAGRPIRAALAVSRAGRGRPAPGFFDRARRLGLPVGTDEALFHARLVAELHDQ
jgi:hypothetical protein